MFKNLCVAVATLLIAASVSAGNWNSGGGASDSVLNRCMTAGLRNFEAVISQNPELFIKLMGIESVPAGFQPQTPRQHLFMKLVNQHENPMTLEDRTDLRSLIVTNCDYSKLKTEGKVYRFIAQWAEDQERNLKISLNGELTYQDASRQMMGSVNIDIDRLMTEVSEREIDQFMRRYEKMSVSSGFEQEIARFTNLMKSVFGTYDMEYQP